MNKIILIGSLIFGSLSFAGMPQLGPGSNAHLVQSFEENGQLVQVYVQESFADETTYCSVKTIIKTDLKTKKIISSESTEKCSHI